MGRKAFKDFANTLPAMLVGWRMQEDLETLASSSEWHAND
jgi:hypothetical protein